MDFVKMHGLGNDFIILSGKDAIMAENLSQLARDLCAEHTGIGADGLVLILPSQCADARMRIINKDGSEAEMCGNAIRCIGKLLYETGAVTGETCTIETLGGLKQLKLFPRDGCVEKAAVDMGQPCFNAADIPMATTEPQLETTLDGCPVCFHGVSMGNPHAVTFDVYPETPEMLARWGSAVESDPAFPAHTNVEFVRILSPDHVCVQVWERGAGATLACGTGACAVQSVGFHQGRLARRVAVTLPGGTLETEVLSSGHILMTGPATLVFRGSL